MNILSNDSFQSFRKIATPFAVGGLLLATLLVPALLGSAGAAEEVIATCEVETTHAVAYMLEAQSACNIPRGTDITKVQLEVWLDDGGAVFVDGREIYRIPNDPGIDHEVRNVSTGLDDGQNFLFKVEARNAFDNNGAPMGEAHGRAILKIFGDRTTTPPPPPPPPPIPGPTTLSGNCTGGNSPQVNLNWHPVANQNSNGLQKRVNGGDWSFVGAIPLTQFSYTDRSVSFGNTYEYRVKTDPQVASNIVAIPVSFTACGGVHTPAPTADIKANGSDGPITIPFNTAATLTWTSQNATNCTVTPGGFTGTSNTSGRTTGNLTSSQTYTLNCSGPGGTASDTVTVNVQSAPQVSCTVNVNQVNINQTVVFTGHGGNGAFAWTGGGTPATGNGGTFSTQYGNAGVHTVTVTSAGQSATCSVTVNNPPQQVTCAPGNQTVGINQTASFVAGGGNGTFSWSAPGGNPSTGSGSSFGTSYGASGGYAVTVTSAGQSATCSVTVNPPQQVTCAPGSQNVGVNQFASFVASGGNGIFSWIAPNGNPSSGSGNTFSTFYSFAGSQNVVVTSGGNTATCSVNVTQVQQQLSCSPGSQNANVNQTVSFVASGGAGSYIWNAQDGSPSTGSGNTFSTTYFTGGSRNVSVTSGGQIAYCLVNIQANQVTADIKANGSDGTVTIPFNSAATISWTSQNATNCTVTPGGFTGTSNSGISTGNLTNNVTYFLSCTGPAGTATDSVTVNVTQQQGNLTCMPSNQTANVNQNVFLFASGGTGSYNWFVPGGLNTSGGFGSTLTVSYPNSGNYTITVSSGGQSATCFVNVSGGQAGNLQVTKNVLNRTTNQTFYSNSIEAQGLDVLEFEIRVRNADNTSGNVTVQDILPSQLFYVPNSTTVDGQTVADGIVGSGYNLGFMNPNQEKIIKFRATVYYGVTPQLITNQVRATMNNAVQNAYASVNIRNRGQVLGVADIVTGPGDYIPLVLAIGFIGSVASYFGIFRYKLIRLGTSDGGPISELHELVMRIREEEKHPDTKGPPLIS